MDAQDAEPFEVKVFRGSRTRREVVTFLFVGLLNTGFGYAVYAIAYLAGLSPSVALAVAFGLGTLFNFVTNGRIVFQSSRLGALPRYGLLAVVTFIVNAVGLRAAISSGLGPLEAQALVMCLTVPFSFIVSKFLVFNRRRLVNSATGYTADVQLRGPGSYGPRWP